MNPLQGRSVVLANNTNRDSDSAREGKRLLYFFIILFVKWFFIH
ncbi:MAG: hypothetical protein AVDCRST_MAG37-2103 [uncultured Rubrobacteraceae bacterium]|uniref:Uncharacterized protein n=1 Tax=uncultured Rubrobacteraceae bacterium TaxID=349277 RepID=A0A6J4QT43_9ACTN|nr:MAG: hypothetical protein AVDCRST_MAG37-2103 [uncultured Rubrobacteraceae bacterium]